jgi:eukaryotic-like serine/threonine-protein kinase
MKHERFGKYTLVDRLGKGGMAEVFLAQAASQGGFQKYLAVKRLLPPCSQDEQIVAMLADEARLSVWLNHPNIVQVLDFGRVGRSYYLAMEYVDGCDLCDLIRPGGGRQGRALPIGTALYVMIQVAEALDYAHRRKNNRGERLGIIHRDVSPHNVLISREGQVKLADFGLARATISIHASHAGVIRGKFSYMPKEQAHGRAIDHRIDLFATGATLYEALAGVKPYNSATLPEQLLSLEKPVPPPSAHTPAIPEAIDDITMQALSPDPEDRYPTAEELANDLRDALAQISTFGVEAQRLAALVREARGEPVASQTAQLPGMSLAEYPVTDGSIIRDELKAVKKAFTLGGLSRGTGPVVRIPREPDSLEEVIGPVSEERSSLGDDDGNTSRLGQDPVFEEFKPIKHNKQDKQNKQDRHGPLDDPAPRFAEADPTDRSLGGPPALGPAAAPPPVGAVGPATDAYRDPFALDGLRTVAYSPDRGGPATSLPPAALSGELPATDVQERLPPEDPPPPDDPPYGGGFDDPPAPTNDPLPSDPGFEESAASQPGAGALLGVYDTIQDPEEAGRRARDILERARTTQRSPEEALSAFRKALDAREAQKRAVAKRRRRTILAFIGFAVVSVLLFVLGIFLGSRMGRGASSSRAGGAAACPSCPSCPRCPTGPPLSVPSPRAEAKVPVRTAPADAAPAVAAATVDESPDAAPPPTPTPPVRHPPVAAPRPPREGATKKAASPPAEGRPATVRIGYLSVTSTSPARVYIDDAPSSTARTPVIKQALPPGIHRVRVYFEAARSFSDTQWVNIQAGQHASIAFTSQ